MGRQNNLKFFVTKCRFGQRTGKPTKSGGLLWGLQRELVEGRMDERAIHEFGQY